VYSSPGPKPPGDKIACATWAAADRTPWLGLGIHVRGGSGGEAFHFGLAGIHRGLHGRYIALMSTVMYPRPSFSRASTSTAEVFNAVSIASKTAVKPWVLDQTHAKGDWSWSFIVSSGYLHGWAAR